MILFAVLDKESSFYTFSSWITCIDYYTFYWSSRL